MFEIGGLELLIIVLVALVVLGPNKLPDATLSLARTFNKIKKNITLFQRTLFTEIALKEEQEKEGIDQSSTSPAKTPNAKNSTNDREHSGNSGDYGDPEDSKKKLDSVAPEKTGGAENTVAPQIPCEAVEENKE